MTAKDEAHQRTVRDETADDSEGRGTAEDSER